MSDPKIEMVSVEDLRPYANNARKHSKKQIAQIAQIAESIRRFGFTNPALISDTGEILAGHGRVRAAQHIGLEMVPTVRLSHLSQAERRAYVLADNKLALNAGWDADLLATELQGLIDLDFDVELTGFSLAEIDIILDEARERSTQDVAPEDEVPDLPGPPITREGDVWVYGVSGSPRAA